jgi:hypothetical protein|tara:strand:+ start:25294 stop:26076 length:783 start_codon:yes stop_codon:yes gene_type:complete
MRLIKAQNTNLRNITGKGVKYDVNDQVIIDTTNVMLVAKGTTAQRPTTPVNGHIRYNTDDEQFEAYQNGAWRELRFKEPNQDPGIIQQNLGNGDASELYFGPLDSQDVDFPVPVAAQNILVFVENVFQISGTNYVLEQNPGTTLTITSIISVGTTTTIQTDGSHGLTGGDSVYIEGVETDPDDNIEFLNTDDSTSPGVHGVISAPAANQLELAVDTSTGVPANYTANSGRIITYLPGWYVKFTSAPDLGKPITVLHNFDK